MTGKSPAFSFYPKDYESDECVKLMSLEQEGAYLRLLCHAWLEGSIPADVPSLAAICRVRPSKMAKLWPGIARCWREKDGRFFNGRQEREREKQEDFRRKNVENGRKGGRPRNPAVTSGLSKSKPKKSLPSPFPSPSPSATNEQRTTELRPPAAPEAKPAFPSVRAANVFLRHNPDGEPPGVMFKTLRPLVEKHSWDVVEPEMEAFLLQTATVKFRSWPKFAEGFGTWANGNGTAIVRAGPQARAPSTAAEKTAAAVDQFLRRGGGG